MGIIDLPNEIILLIALQQRPRDLNALLRTNRCLASLLKVALVDRVCALRDELTGKRGLYLAAARGDRVMLRLFIARGMHMLVAGGAVLTDAVMSLDVAGLRVLLECGIDPEARGPDMETALSVACKHNRFDAIRLLIDDRRVDVNLPDADGRTLLSLAAGWGNVGVVFILLADQRVDINSLDNARRTPLSHAAGSGHEWVVRVLLADPRVDVQCRDYGGRTALSHVEDGGHLDILRSLLADRMVVANIH